MSHSDRNDGSEPASAARRWRAGAVGGLVAGAAMGAVLHLGLGLMPTIGALVGTETVLAGWAVHLFNSTLFGGLFVAVFDRPFFADLRGDVGGCLSLGVVHSAALGMLTGGLLLPAAIAIEGATSLPVPTLPVPGLTASFEFGAVIAVAHLLYGLVLGRVFAAFTLAEGDIGWLPVDPVDR
ncbi:complement resistance protein TraT [Halorubrum sp. 2020YC2]|uniref:complement resistance protein TraT n=1 Tax=Halorubrum sp. 2020YC2 TaxID=2836432 RepID=UPI001BEA8374|nr:complement resistance protein TraT [Halorubrum sp. 2020YC2]QWC18367.1 complement resistance protein TraT [Halorubrum sp. 2020YC2]